MSCFSGSSSSWARLIATRKAPSFSKCPRSHVSSVLLRPGRARVEGLRKAPSRGIVPVSKPKSLGFSVKRPAWPCHVPYAGKAYFAHENGFSLAVHPAIFLAHLGKPRSITNTFALCHHLLFPVSSDPLPPPLHSGCDGGRTDSVVHAGGCVCGGVCHPMAHESSE